LSKLIVIAYDSVAKAQEVLAVLMRLQKEHLISMDDAVVAERQQDGKIKLHQTSKLAGAGAAGGALWGGLIGLIFFMPLLGAAIGAASGAAAGALSDIGVDDNFMKQVGAKIEPGTAALFVLVREATADKVLPEIQPYGGEVLQTSLNSEQEAALKEALESQPAAAGS
jgi:uncharacterized membrane protein